MLCDLPLHYNLIQSYKNKTWFDKYINLVAKLLFNLSYIINYMAQSDFARSQKIL